MRRKCGRVLDPFVRHCLIAAVPLSFGTVAQAKTDLVVNTAVNAHVASNPYLSAGSNQGSASVVATISPAWTMQDAESELTLSGTVQHSEFTRLYPSSDAVSAGVNGKWRFSPRWTATVSGGFEDSIVGETDFFRFGNAQLGELPQTADDLALIGTRTKRRSLAVQAGLVYNPNARETFNIGLFANTSRALGIVNDQKYASYGNTFSYSRQVSRRTSAGLATTVSRYECRSQGACYVNSFQPQLTLSTGLGVDWKLSASGGVTFSQVRIPSEARDSLTPAGSLSLCRDKLRLNVCLTASQTIDSTSSNGARPSLSLNSAINYTLDRKSRLGLYLGYTKSAASAFTQQDYSYFSGRITGSREIARRLAFTVDAGYDRSSVPLLGNRSNISVSAGLSFSLSRRV